MISDHNLGALMGAPVAGPNNEKIGTVGQVFVDPGTGKPNWITVHTGLFGRHESFVPVEQAEWDHEVLHVPFDKDVVKDAPRIDTDQALSPEDEVSLYRYYGIPTDADRDEAPDAGARPAPVVAETDRQGDRIVPSSEGEQVEQPAHEEQERPIGERLAEATRRFVDKAKSGGESRHESHQDENDVPRPAEDEAIVSEPSAAGAPSESGRMRMRKYVIVEEQVPVENDIDSPGDPETFHRQ